MIIQSDSLEWLKQQEADSIDHIITDPPYLIDFMAKKWDSKDNVAGSVDYWKEALRVCKAGSYALVFGHSRTHHRVMTAMEDAGWEIRDCLMWLHSQGFPKSSNLGNGWGSALKPAYEPIIMARKPFKGTLKNNWNKNSLGGLNIDACRIGTDKVVAHHSPKGTFAGGEEGRGSSKEYYENTGRFPANIILDEEAGELLEEQMKGVSRFFYCAKVSTKERNQGCEELEDKEWKHHKISGSVAEDGIHNKNGTGTVRGFSKNNHPTVKPIKLMEYLIKLVSKEEQTILDPFAGSGTTGIACNNMNRKFILIEKEDEYIKIITSRLSKITMSQNEKSEEIMQNNQNERV